jgi:hypothetical protein
LKPAPTVAHSASLVQPRVQIERVSGFDMNAELLQPSAAATQSAPSSQVPPSATMPAPSSFTHAPCALQSGRKNWLRPLAAQLASLVQATVGSGVKVMV